ncbi:2'-5' RNA ligase family protein [Mucilaginibacter achroorhodeus]|uniref:2'-5' RNA ligase family protein n=1 Tax=Mucilaginibacter achroorhodeus TaxID=2599294 RepID=A0A563U5K0_9SPHI|nr:2'-5' RNA ligase family protein [Mucilaginibacter achroorhodeus]TWR26609.1 2'-5' RNA ligase family protein [Mucilaginibacter achroorhodeus]
MTDVRQIMFMNLISLPDESNAHIMRFKRACAKHIGQFASMNSRAHISFPALVFDENTSATSFNYDDYYRVIESILGNVPAISLKVKGFEYLQHGDQYRTICAALELDPVTMRWFSFFEKIFPAKQKIKPHITIARKIPVASFNKLWPHFQKIDFKDRFTVRNITVLHNPSNQAGPYQLYKDISLRKGN